MSQNQSRAEGSESKQYRKTGRSTNSNQQHHFGSGKGGGGSSAPTNPFNRSFKKNNNNAKGRQSRERNLNVSSDSSNSSLAPSVQNGVHQQQLPPRVSDTHVSSTTARVNKPDVPNPKITQAVPRVPSSNVSTAISDSQSTIASAKDPGDASRSFPLQFGSISAGLMNGMQIPARTNSCPPNSDERKKNQARHEALMAVPTMPAPSLPKHHLPKNEARILDQPNAGGAQPMPKSKRDIQVSSALPVSQTQTPPSHSIPCMPMQLPFHQPQVAVHFGGHNPQIQSQPITGTSLPMSMPMALTMGNPSVQQPLFVSGLQPHPMQSQGIMHQGQSLNFSLQMGPQMLPQLGNMGINMAPQFPQKQVGKYTASRKTVKITHPETHEELRLDGSPGLRSHPNMPPQSRPIPSFPPNHLMNNYPNFYNATSLFFPPVSSVPLNSTQTHPSQPQRFYNQVTVKLACGSHGEKDSLLPTSSPSVEKGDCSKVLRSHGEGFVDLPKEFKSSSSSSMQPSKRSSDASSTSAAVLGPIGVKNDVLNTASSGLVIVDDFASVSFNSASKTTGIKSDVVDYESSPVSFPIPSEGAMKEENEDIENDNSGLSSLSLSSVKEKVLSEPNAAKSAVGRGTKKKKELYRKAEAAGTSSDLYMAHRVLEEKKETEISAEGVEIASNIGIKQTYVIASQETAIPSNESAPSKVVPDDDWEDAAEISTPQLETSRDKNEGNDGDGHGLMTNRYSRDFLLMYAEQCADLPENFEITSHVAGALMVSSITSIIADPLMVSSANSLRVPKKKKGKKKVLLEPKKKGEIFLPEPPPSPGLNIDWLIGGSRPDPPPSPGLNIDWLVGGSIPDRCGTTMGEEDKWRDMEEEDKWSISYISLI